MELLEIKIWKEIISGIVEGLLEVKIQKEIAYGID